MFLTRTRQSCSECRRRKIKCNRQLPCDMCLSRGEAEMCEEQQDLRAKGDRSFPRMKDFRSLAARVAELETLVAQLRGVENVTHAAPNSASPDQGANFHPGADTGGSEQVQRSSAVSVELRPSGSFDDSPMPVPEHEEDSVALVLEDFAMGHSGNQGRAGARRGPAVSELLHHVVAKAVSILPTAERSLIMVQFFLDHVDWNTKVLHAPSYMDEFNAFAMLPKDQATRQVRPEWLCVHLMVLCLSLHLLEATERERLGVIPEQWQEIARGLFLASREVLFASDFLAHHTLEHLQCLILQGGYQYDADNAADSHWALMGSAVKMAQNLGLHRLGREHPDFPREWPEAWQSPLRREIGRRVWWNIVFLDWSHALSHGLAYSVHPSQNSTAFPSNINDADLTLDRPLVSRPVTEYTSSSFTIFRLRFLILYHEHIDHLIQHRPADYNFIGRMDGRIKTLIDGLPEYFNNDIDAQRLSARLGLPCVMSESITIRLIGANRLLRLHRPYLTLGFQDPRYRQSTEQCVRSAQSIMDLCETARVAAPSLLNYWLVLFYAFAAAIVMFIQLCNNKEADKQQTRIVLLRILDILRGARDISAAARNATSIIERLMSAERKLSIAPSLATADERSDAGGTDQDSLFRRVVQGVLGNAAISARHQHHTRPMRKSTARSPLVPTALPATVRPSSIESAPTAPPQTKNDSMIVEASDGAAGMEGLDDLWFDAVQGHATAPQVVEPFDQWSDLAGFAPEWDMAMSGRNGRDEDLGESMDLEAFLAGLTS